MAAVFILAGLICVSLVVMVYVDIFWIAGRRAKMSSKLLWAIGIPATVPVAGPVGLILYLAIGRKQLLKETASTPSIDGATYVTHEQWQRGSVAKPGEALPSTIVTPQTMRGVARTFGSVLTIVAILSGLSVVGVIIAVVIAIYSYEPPSSGAKTM